MATKASERRYGVVAVGTKCACGFVLSVDEREKQKRVAVPKCFDCYEEAGK